MAFENILIVEDEEEIQELVRYNLVKEGYRVCYATDGRGALRVAGSELPDLIVLDLMLLYASGELRKFYYDRTAADLESRAWLLEEQIAQSHGGCATVESSLGEGSTFSVHLPG